MFAICFCWLLLQQNGITGQQEDGKEGGAEVLHYGNHKVDPWKLRMVHKVNWHKSENYMAVHRVSAVGQKRLGQVVPKPFGDAQISFFYGMDIPNMLINYKNYPDGGAAYCEIGIIPDNVLDQLEHFSEESSVPEHCWFEPERMYPGEEPVEKRRQTAFCIPKGMEQFKWQIANGTFNPPSREPQCLFDFYEQAIITYEYNLFRYCAKGYFFNGKDYNNEERKRGRKDWLLYLAEGQVYCEISGKVESDRLLLSKGYTIELIHTFNFDQLRFIPGLEMCPDMSATLVSYHDNVRSGEFFFGAVVGAGKMDGGEFTWSYRPGENKKFWNQDTMQKEYAGMNLGKRACYLQYHKLLARTKGGEWVKGRYNLQLRVTHHCTERAMRQVLNFDVSEGPKQVPEGVYEDRGIRINLYAGRLERNTGQVLCALEKPNNTESPCVMAQGRPVDKNLKKHGQRCGQPRYMSKKEWVPRKTLTTFGRGNVEIARPNFYSPAFMAYPSNCESGYRCMPQAEMNTNDCYANADRERKTALYQPGFNVVQHATMYFYFPNEEKPVCLYSTADYVGPDVAVQCGPCVCKPTGITAAGDGKCLVGSRLLNLDFDCHDDKFCAMDRDKKDAYGICKKWRMKESGEPCRYQQECYPGFMCATGKCLKIIDRNLEAARDMSDYTPPLQKL